MTEKSSLAVAVDLVAAPNQAFAAIKEQPSAWLPLVVLLLTSSATTFTYLNSVDLGWLQEQNLQNVDIPESQREQIIRATSSAPQAALAAFQAVIGAIVFVLLLVVGWLYYGLVSFLSHDGIRLKQWFAFVCWCTLPAALGFLASLVNVLASDARFMPQQELNPLAFGNLLAIDLAGAGAVERWLLSSVDVTLIWSIVLSVLGYQAWTGRSTVKAVAVVLGPWACIIAIITLFTLT